MRFDPVGTAPGSDFVVHLGRKDRSLQRLVEQQNYGDTIKQASYLEYADRQASGG
jgi:hypothetical protein